MTLLGYMPTCHRTDALSRVRTSLCLQGGWLLEVSSISFFLYPGLIPKILNLVLVSVYIGPIEETQTLSQETAGGLNMMVANCGIRWTRV